MTLLSFALGVSLILIGMVVALVVAQFSLPRQWAILPTLIAVCHLPNVTVLDVGFYSFTPVRLMILAGLARALMDGRLTWSSRDSLDCAMAVFVVIALGAAFLQGGGIRRQLTFRLGLVYNVAGIYLLARAYIRDLPGVIRWSKSLVLVLVPLALLLFVEQRTNLNSYSRLGQEREVSSYRGGRVRAQGPFSHAISAGMAGATSVPLAVMLWNGHRSWAVAGVVAGVLVSGSSASSTPIAALLVASGTLGLWHGRRWVWWLVAVAVAGVLIIQLQMREPIWSLLGEVDFVGGSTGDHRVKLIDASIYYFKDWWLAGTDYTAHWVKPLEGNPMQSDITNYYLRMGVTGGVGLVLAFAAFLALSFGRLGRRMQVLRDRDARRTEFILWCAGAALVAHAVGFIGCSYWDQVFALFYMLIGAVPAITARVRSRASLEDTLVRGPAG